MSESQKINSVFLTGKGKMRLNKAFMKDGTVQSYPNAKNFTSHLRTYDITIKGFRERVKDMQEFANKGACLLKGELKKEIKEESRAGLSLKGKKNRTLLLDIDKFPYNPADVKGLEAARKADASTRKAKVNKMLDGNKGKIGKNELECLAEHVLSIFPYSELQNTTYMVHASSSMGTKQDNTISMHIEFILGNSVSPEIQTTWLQAMNLYVKELTERLTLSANGLSLKYPLDISVASNAKLIFIAHPFFEENSLNPIESKDRIFLVEKPAIMLPTSILTVAQRRDALKAAKDKIIKSLRHSLGLPTKTAKTSTIRVGSRIEEFLKNPDGMDFDIVDENGDFVHLNVNNGDSNAYWFLKADPTLVYNFKDEPVFRLEDANPLFHEECLRRYAEYINSKKGGRQIIRRVLEKGGAFVCVEINETGKIETLMEAKDRASAEDWGMQYGLVLPENVAFAHLEYNPQVMDPYLIELRENLPPIETINTYVLPETLRLAEKKESFEVEPAQMAECLKLSCPATFRVIAHVLNDKVKETEHFINWLVTAANERKKTGTTWLLQGIQGTGKGILWEHVIQPIFGQDNTKKITIDELEDKFNANLKEHTMILVDEFRHSDASGTKRLENKLKLMATEGEFSMRAMQTEYKQSENFFNMIFFSNNRDSMRVEEHDRRINVGPRQETSLPMTLGKGNYEEGLKAVEILIETIKEERSKFANFIYSASYSKNLAKVALRNEAKDTMQEASSTRMEDFARVIIRGSLNGFMYAAQDVPQVLEELRQPLMSIMQEVQRQWTEEKPEIFLTSTQLAAVFSFYQDKMATHAAMKKYLSRHVSSDKIKPERRGKSLGYVVQIPYNDENKMTFEDIKKCFPAQKDNITNMGG